MAEFDYEKFGRFRKAIAKAASTVVANVDLVTISSTTCIDVETKV